MRADNQKRNLDAKYAWTKKTIADFDDWSKEEVVMAFVKAQKEIASLKTKLDNLERKELVPTPTKNKTFKKSWPIATKLVFLLLREFQPLTTEDFNKFLLDIDSTFKSYNNSRHLITNILGQMVKAKRLVKVKIPGIATGFYLLPDWVDENGTPKEAFQPIIDMFK